MKEFANKYLEYLNTKFKGLNLTRITEFSEFYNKQVLDSLLPLEESKIFYDSVMKHKLFIDIGFGGGFPLLPVAYRYKDIKFLGFDGKKKKVKAVSELAKLFHMEHVKVYHKRLEELFFDQQAIITFKAVGKVADSLSKIRTNQKLKVFFYKGPNFYELESLKSILKDWALIEDKLIAVPETSGRLLLGFENKRELTFSSDKSLVKVSSFL
jgi:16S rRNA (guanine527-N7)-methyltransferase